MPDDRIRLLLGQWATPTPASPSRAISCVVRHHAMSDPRAIVAPAGSFEVLHRAAAELGERERVVLGVLGEVGVQAHVEPLGKLGRANHQRLGDAERAARCQGDAHHGAVRPIVMAGDRLLACGEDLVVVGDHIVGRQSAVLLAQRHRATSRMEAHAELGRGGDLGRQQIAGVARMQVQVIARCRAAAEGQLGETDERAGVHGLGVDRPPQRIQRLQPAEQRLVGHRRIGAGEVLEDVVMGVDEARRHQAIAGVDRLGCRRLGVGRGRRPR